MANKTPNSIAAQIALLKERGISQGYDEYAQQLMHSNPHPWLPGKDAQGKPVATEVYYQIDFVTNKSRVAIKANEVVN